MTRSDVIAKIRALTKKTTGNGATPGEAEAAFNKARDLMELYAIRDDELRDNSDDAPAPPPPASNGWIDVAGQSVEVRSPYNPNFVARAKTISGRWSDTSRAWIFPLSQYERVVALCRGVYGTDGTDPVVTLTVTLQDHDIRGTTLWIAGRQVARVYGRDSGAKFGQNIVLISGRFWSSGSRKNYGISCKDGTTVEILDVPEPAARAYVEAHPDSAWIGHRPVSPQQEPALRVCGK